MDTPQAPSQTEVVTLSQLADLAGLDRTFFSEHRSELPPTLPIHNGNQGRPQLCYPLDQLAEFILNRTGFLSDIEARLRLSLAPAVYRKRGSKMSRFYDDHTLFEADGQLHVLPRDHGKLSPELDAKVRAALAADQAALRERRAAKRQPRNTTDPQVMQP